MGSPGLSIGQPIALVVAAVLAVGCAAGPGSGEPSVPAPSASSAASSAIAEASSALSPSPVPSPPGTEPSVSATPTGSQDACGTGLEGLLARRVEMPADIVIGNEPAELTTHAIGLRNGSYHATDSVPGGIGLEPDEPATRADRHGHVPMSLATGRIVAAEVFTGVWTDVLFQGGHGYPPEDRLERSVAIGGVGDGWFLAPATPGEYVVTVLVNWQTECLDAHSFGYAHLVVR